jgi:hypothetical protein
VVGLGRTDDDGAFDGVREASGGGEHRRETAETGVFVHGFLRWLMTLVTLWRPRLGVIAARSDRASDLRLIFVVPRIRLAADAIGTRRG